VQIIDQIRKQSESDKNVRERRKKNYNKMKNIIVVDQRLSTKKKDKLGPSRGPYFIEQDQGLTLELENYKSL